MDTPEENTQQTGSGGILRDASGKFIPGTAPAPGPGRPKGRISLSAAYARALERLDPEDKSGRKHIADTIAEAIVTSAKLGAIDAAREIRVATEGDSLRIDGAVEVVYVNDWRNATADSPEAASWDPSSAWGSEKVQLGSVRTPLAENHNGNGSHR